MSHQPKVKFRGKYPKGGPVIVREEFERLGFKWIPPNAPNDHANSLWVMRMENEELRNLKPMQKVNFLPAMPELCWKHLLHLNISKAVNNYGKEDFKFWPEGFVLPDELEKLKEREQENKKMNKFVPYIVKPTSNACGTGIFCITDTSQINEKDLETKYVVQEYILNPLLIDGFKVTFRLYVIVTSFAPLKVYLYPEGLGRLCSQRYTEDPESFVNIYQHLTNYDLNKYNVEDFLNKKSESFVTDELRTDFQTVMRLLKDQGKDVDKIWDDIKDIVAKTFFSVERKIGYYVTTTVPYMSNAYEILGFDILIDQNMKSWLIEVNHAPNLDPHTELETNIKRSMIRDALQLVDVCHKDTKRTKELSDQLYYKLINENNNITKKECWDYVQSELEYRRKGKWDRVFPNKDSALKYRKFIQENSSNEKLINMMNRNIDFFVD